MKTLKELDEIANGFVCENSDLNELELIMLVLYFGVRAGMEDDLGASLNVMKGQYLLALEEEKENK